MSPDLSSLYNEDVMENVYDTSSIKINRKNLNNLRYAGDTALIRDSQEKVQAVLDRVVQESEKMGLDIILKYTLLNSM